MYLSGAWGGNALLSLPRISSHWLRNCDIEGCCQAGGWGVSIILFITGGFQQSGLASWATCDLSPHTHSLVLRKTPHLLYCSAVIVSNSE